MPLPNISRAELLARCRAIRRTLPVPEGYPRTGRAWPTARIVQFARRAGWPLATAPAPDRGAEPVVVAPAAWLEELARRLGCEWVDVCRGRC